MTRLIAIALLLSGCGDDMALLFPPDGWVVTDSNGAIPPPNVLWGRDVDEDTTTVLTGGRSIRFINVTPASSPRLQSEQFIPVGPSTDYVIESTYQADSNSGSNTLLVAVMWYKNDKTASSTASTIAKNTAVTTANTWETTKTVVKSPSDAGYAKIRIGKVNNAFNAYYDTALFYSAVPRWRLERNSTQSISSGGTGSTIEWDTEITKVGVTFTAASTTVTIISPGFYFVDAAVLISSLADGDYMAVGINVNGTFARSGSINYQGSAGNPLATVSAVLELTAGDTVSIQAIHGNGSAKNTTNNGNFLYFDGVRIE